MNSSAIKTDFIVDPVSLSQDLIRCKSVTPDDDGALNLVASHLQAHGFTIHRLRFDDRGTYPVDNIFAHIGSGAPHICLMGHTDVVPAGDVNAWTHDPFGGVILNDILYGRGAADMKTGVAAGIAAAIEFAKTETFTGTISFLITGDEEAESINGSVRVIEWLKDQNLLPNDALVCEPSNPETMAQLIRVGRRGSYNADLIVHGKQGHSAYPDRFINPIDRLIQLLTILTQFEWDQGNEFMPRTHLALTSVDVGNPTRNVVPASASAKFNIRFNNIWTSDRITAKLHELFNSTQIPYELSFTCNAESFLTPQGKLTNCILSAIRTVSGSDAVPDTGGGTSDARFIAPYCPVVEYGVITKTNHQVDEHMNIHHIYEATATYLEFLKLYFGDA